MSATSSGTLHLRLPVPDLLAPFRPVPDLHAPSPPELDPHGPPPPGPSPHDAKYADIKPLVRT